LSLTGSYSIVKEKAFVAQLDRALPSGGKGRGFESRRMHHQEKSNDSTSTSSAHLYNHQLDFY
jgi:hypothetical protein